MKPNLNYQMFQFVKDAFQETDMTYRISWKGTQGNKDPIIFVEMLSL